MDAAPQQSNTEPQSARPEGDLARWPIYAHLVAVATSLAMSLADRGLLITHDFSRLFNDWCGVIVLPAIFSIWIFPFLMFFLVVTDRVQGKSALLSVLAEGLLCLAHLHVMLPMVE